MARLTRMLAGALVIGCLAMANRAQADQGSSVVESKKLAEKLVVLGATTYQVTDATAMEDKDGHAITLAALPTIAQGASQDDAAVWFEASDTQVATPVLHVLRLTGATPK